VAFVVIDDSGEGILPHHDLLKQTMGEFASSWARLQPLGPAFPDGCRVFENVSEPHEPVRPFDVDMKYSLGLVLRWR
jgi:hypothetical protein